MPINIIPDQSANTDVMLDGNILHGETAGGSPYIKEIYETIINSVNSLNVESNALPGAANIGVKVDPFTNFVKATNDVEACLEGIDSALGAGKQIYPFWAPFLYKGPSYAEVNVDTDGTISEITAELGIDGGVMIDTLDTVTGWSAVDAGATIALNTTNYLAGSGAVSFDKNGTNILARARKTFTAINGTGAIVTVDVYVPDLGDVVNLRLYFHSTLGVHYAYWNLTTDVEGNPLIVGWNKIRVDLNSVPNGTNGTFNVGSIVNIDLGIVTGLATTTLTGILWNSMVYYKPALDSTLIDFDVMVNNNVQVKELADTYTFEAIHAGAPVIKNTLINNTVLKNDVISINLRNIPTNFGGQYLKVKVIVV